MKTNLLLIAAIACTISINAQVHEWTKGTGNTAIHGNKTYVEPSGNAIYTYGEHSDFDSENSVTLDPGGIAQVLTGEFASSYYLIKMTPEGQLMWAQTFSASSYVFIQDISTDAAGNCYIAGVFLGTMDVDNSSNNYTLTTNTDLTSFIVKLAADGEFLWAQQYDKMAITTIAIRSNALFCAGYFIDQCDFDNSVSSSVPYTSQGGSDCFVMRLNTEGEHQWVKILGSSGNTEYITDISTTPTGMLNITGSFWNSVDFNPDAGVTTLNAVGEMDIFILQLSATGEFQWAQSVGSPIIDAPTSLNTASTGAIYITGVKAQANHIEPYEDITIFKFSNLGNLLWSKTIGGIDMDQAISSTLDENENLYVTGDFGSMDLDFDPGIGEVYQDIDPTLGSIGYILKLTSDGDFVWVTSLDGTSNSIWSASYHNGALYTTGSFFNSLDMAPGTPFYQLDGNTENYNSYLCKLDVSQTLDASELNTEISPFKLYPNPSQSVVYAKLEQGSIVTVYDLAGTALMQETGQQEPTALNIDALASGTYLVEVSQNGRKSVQKLVKE